MIQRKRTTTPEGGSGKLTPGAMLVILHGPLAAFVNRTPIPAAPVGLLCDAPARDRYSRRERVMHLRTTCSHASHAQVHRLYSCAARVAGLALPWLATQAPACMLFAHSTQTRKG